MSEHATLRVDPANAEQLAAWDGGEGAYWAEHAEHYDRAIAGHHRPFMATAAIGPGENVLDIGCGTGETTREAGRTASSGSALGVDLSSRMLDYARVRAEAEGLANVEFLQADAQVHPFAPASCDVAISRTSAMFFGDHVAAFANIHRALRPGGRVVLLTWQPLGPNEWLREIATALAGPGQPRIPPPGVGPFALSEAETVRALLTDAGFTAIELVGNEAPMWFGADAEDAYQFILGGLGWMLEGLDADGREAALAALRRTAVAHESDEGVTFASAAWITTATA